MTHCTNADKLGKWFPTFERNVSPSSPRVQDPKEWTMDLGTLKRNVAHSFETKETPYPMMQHHTHNDQNPLKRNTSHIQIKHPTRCNNQL
jgi:hypothetical protein